MNTLFIEFNAIIDGMQLKANIHNATLGPVTVVTTFGALDMTEVKKLLDQVLSEGRPEFNQWIQTQSIIVPNKIFGLFGLSDLTLKYHNGYVEAGLTPSFIPLSTPVFKPVEDFSTDETKYRFVETIDENDKVTFRATNGDSEFLQQ